MNSYPVLRPIIIVSHFESSDYSITLAARLFNRISWSLSLSLQILPSYLVKASGDGVLFNVEADLYLKSVLLTFKTLPGMENNGDTVVFVKDGIGNDVNFFDLLKGSS